MVMEEALLGVNVWVFGTMCVLGLSVAAYSVWAGNKVYRDNTPESSTGEEPAGAATESIPEASSGQTQSERGEEIVPGVAGTSGGENDELAQKELNYLVYEWGRALSTARVMEERIEEALGEETAQLGSNTSEIDKDTRRARDAAKDMYLKIYEVISGKLAEDAKRFERGIGSLGSEMENAGSSVEQMRADLDEMLARFDELREGQEEIRQQIGEG
jgi:hypothetical protein